MKKLVSLLLAGVMVMAMAAPTFAMELNPTPAPSPASVNDVAGLNKTSTVKVAGDTRVPTIKVIVPTGDSVVFNPYKLKYKIGNESCTDQIIFPVQYVVNQSNVPINVTGTVTGTVTKGVVFTGTEDAIEQDETAKKVKLDFVMVEMPVATTAAAMKPNGSWLTSAPAPTDWTGNTVRRVHVTAKSQPIIADDSVSPVKLPAALYKNGKLKVKTPSYAAFCLEGEATTAPTTAWTGADVVSATIVFSFAPQEYNSPDTVEPEVKMGLASTSAADADDLVSAAAGKAFTFEITDNFSDVNTFEVGALDTAGTGTYTWTAEDPDDILDSFTGGTTATQTATVATLTAANYGKSAKIKCTVKYTIDGNEKTEDFYMTIKAQPDPAG